MSFQLIPDILKNSNPLLKWATSSGYRALTSILLALQLGIIVFSMLHLNSFLFFLCLKSMLVVGILIWLIDREKPTKWLIYGTLMLLPSIWGLIIGASSENPGVRYELSVYLLAPICYLLAFRQTGLSFLNSVIPVLKMACGLNLVIFFLLYFLEEGEVYIYLQNLTGFFVQYPDGFIKVNTLQTTLLIFLLPVIVIHFFFKRNALNFILVIGSVLMTLMLGRKAMLVSLGVLILCLFISALYQRSKRTQMIVLVAPFIAAVIIFVQITNVDTAKFANEYIESIPTMQKLQDDVDDLCQESELNETCQEIALRDICQDASLSDECHEVASGNGSQKKASGTMVRKNAADDMVHKMALWKLLYKSKNNICSNENGYKLSISLESAGNPGAIIRSNQIHALVQQISLSPVFGHGLGYIVPQCIRAEQQPWRFELTYLAMAMNIGLLGILVFCIIYVRWMFGAVRANLDRSISFPLLGGSLFFLICAASNPYILAVEYLWIFFIPYLIVHIPCENLPQGKCNISK
jgi:hypothetical protein